MVIVVDVVVIVIHVGSRLEIDPPLSAEFCSAVRINGSLVRYRSFADVTVVDVVDNPMAMVRQQP